MLIGYLQHLGVMISGFTAATQLEMQRTRIPHSYVPWKERTYNKTDAGNKPMIFFPENRLHQRYLMLHPEVVQSTIACHQP